MSNLVQNLKFRKVNEGVDPTELGELLEKAYLAKNRTRHMTKKTFSPSSIGYGQGKCPRYWYLAFDGAEFIEDNDAKGIANMENGTTAHERIAELFQQTGILKESEIELKLENPPVRGFIDLVIEWDGEEAVGEFKTTKQESFLHRKNSMKPMANHLFQILLYMWGRDIRYGFILYENKNTQELLPIPVVMNERNRKIIEDAIEWMRKVHQNWQDQQLPERPFAKNSRECKGCPLRKTCWKEQPEGDVTIEAMSVPKV